MAAARAPDALNQLICLCHDAEEFYGYAAGRIDDPQLQPMLSAAAGLHREISDALRPYVGDAGVRFAASGTIAGKLRQLKGELKAAFASAPDAVLLPELQDAEQSVVQACEGALAAQLDPAAKAVLARRLAILKATQDRIAGAARGTA